MKHNYYLRLFLLVAMMSCWAQSFAQYPAGSPVAINGQLSVVGTNLKNECGNNVQLRGMSTHGLQWHEKCINNSSLNDYVATWKGDILRLALYVGEDGYNTNPAKWKVYIDNMVDECQKRGIYCLIDFHVTSGYGGTLDGTTTDLAIDFWKYISAGHKGKKHVIYEIANEPTVGDWAPIKSYADKVIPVIRANDPKTVIIVGTPFYSSIQNASQITGNPISGSNIMYALHFYTAEGSHESYKQRGQQLIDAGLAVFVTEFGITEANGGGNIDQSRADSWITWMEQRNVSWCNWNYSDDNSTSNGVKQTSASFLEGTCSSQDWTKLSTSGLYIKGKINSADSYSCPASANVVPLNVNLVSPTKDTSVLVGSDVILTASVSGGTATKVEFYNGNTLLGTATSAPFSYTLSKPVKGKYLVKARAYSSETVYGLSSAATIYVNDPQTPFKGTAWPIPGKIEAENYDDGGNQNAYYDISEGISGPESPAKSYRKDDVDLEGNGPNYSVGYTAAGEWLEYTVNVDGSALHSISLSVATVPGGKLHVEFDGVDVTKSITVPPGSWTNWTPVTVTDVPLTFGQHILKVYFETADVNLDFIEVKRTGPVTDVYSADINQGVRLYPNPSSSEFTLTANQTINSINVVDMFGKVVDTKDNVIAGQSLNLGHQLESGSYLLKIQYQGGRTEVLKMVKVK